jgi:RimJ/RimL family protein N-acetyltransferase
VLSEQQRVPAPTHRLAFRQMTADDLDDMAALPGDPAVMRYYPHPKNRVEDLAWLDWNQRLYREEGFGLWLLTPPGHR